MLEMRERDWPELGPKNGLLFETDRLRVSRAAPEAATLISGHLEAALTLLAPGAPMLGLGSTRGPGSAAIRIARDRALLVTNSPLDVAPGWHKDGFGVTPADDAWAIFTLSEAGARDVLAEGMACDPERGSPSAAVHFAGQTCLVLRREDTFEIFTEQPRTWYLEAWLRAVAEAPTE